MKVVHYGRIGLDRLSSVSLTVAAEATLRNGGISDAYRVMVFERDTDEPPTYAEALYIPLARRLGVALEGSVTWARVSDLHSGLHMWANDPEGWDALAETRGAPHDASCDSPSSRR